MHFIDQESGLSNVWSVEFGAPTSPNKSASLQRIGHLAQTMSYDQMLSWSLFYTTLFEMQKSPIVDVVDPDGLVRSQALETPNGTFRITLNGAETHRTMTGNFLADSFGASVNTLPYQQMIYLLLSLRWPNMVFKSLPMSNNYYADLAARFDLSIEFLAKLKAGNILYDEDENGSFFQLYSLPYAGGMFFEIVQRKGKYTGYGAPNAPFRIATQKRLMRPKGMPK